MRPHADAVVQRPHGGLTKHARPVFASHIGWSVGYERVNVADQRRDPTFLNWTERLIPNASGGA